MAHAPPKPSKLLENVIGGHRVAAEADDALDVLDPATGETIGRVALSQTPKLALGPTVGVQYPAPGASTPTATRRSVMAKMAAAGIKPVRVDVAWQSHQPKRLVVNA